MTQAQEQFQMKLSKGRIGEEAIIQALSLITEVKDVTDYTNHKDYQQKGMDFSFLNRRTGVWDRGDAKTNITEYGFTFMELYKKSGDKGWFLTSKSDYIFCYDIYKKKIYYYDLQKMRNYIEKRINEGSLKTSRIKSNGCDGVWLPVDKNPLIKEFKSELI